METNKEIPTAEEFLTLNDEKDFRLSSSGMYLSELLIEFAKFHLSKQAEVIAENKSRLIATKIWNDYMARPHNKGEDYNFSYENMLKDIKSILQASGEYINNLK